MPPESYFSNLWHNLRVADAVDVVVFAFFIYVGLAWFRKARSRFVMLGIVTMIALYAAARILDLALTLMFFQAGITVALVAIVVIFQEELRRTFERLGNPKALRARRQTGTEPWIDDVVASAATMAKARTGALIVFAGEEPLDRHLQGGTALGGQVSTALILSIFDSSSPGHDGAVVIEHGLIRLFGAHLPLSTDISGGEPFGTRHTAAIGLSERSDALVLVVSEERGEISFARDGRLEKVDGMAAVRTRINEFLRSAAPVRRPLAWLTSNLAPKILAVAAAIVTWIVVVGPEGESASRSYHVPITLRHAPAALMLEQPRPASVLVTLSGTERAYRALDPASLMVNVDAEKIHSGAQRVELGQADLELPRGLLLHRIDPDFITIVAHETLKKDYPIHTPTTGSLPAGLRLASVTTKPERVELVVRKRDVGTFQRVETAPIELGEIDKTLTLSRSMSVPSGARLEEGVDPTVLVTVEVVRKP